METRDGSWALWGAGALAGLLAARAWRRSHRRFDFRGRVVLITGGSRGLGLVLARMLVEEGARVAIAARDGEEIERALVDLRSRGGKAIGRACDLVQPAQIDELVDGVQAELGPVEVLIHDAGVIQVGPIETMTRADYEQAMAVHFWAPLQLMERLLPAMRKRGEGRIVNIASIGGKVAVPHLVPYSASKFALVGLSRGMAAEVAKDRVYITTVNPGLMRTGSPRNALFKGKHQEEYAWFSISDSLPLLSMSAENAARQIIEAARFGKAEATLSPVAKLGAALNALAPEITADLAAVAHRFLPSPGGIGMQSRKGSQSFSAWSPSPLTALTESAAARNNEAPIGALS